MADTELEFPEKPVQVEVLPQPRKPSDWNFLLAVMFATGGLILFGLAYWTYQRNGDLLVILVCIGIGVLCLGVAWIGSLLEGRL